MKTVLVTGASSGIGKATVDRFSQKGWRVLATMRRLTDFDHEQQPNVFPLTLDVTDPASIRTCIAQALAIADRIDVIVNNAGYGGYGAFELTTPEQVQAMFAVNVLGPMALIQAILPHFRHHRAGVILNVSSIGGLMTYPLYSVYHSTKWAVEGFSESVRYELQQVGVTIKLIEPGATRTDFNGRSQVRFHRSDLPDYDAYAEKLNAVAEQTFAQAMAASKVATIIFEAATDGKNKLRYPVGNRRSMVLLTLRKVLPTEVFIRFIQRVTERS